MTHFLPKISRFWLIAGLTASIFGLCSRWWWPAEYFTHFQFHYWLGLSLLSLLYVLSRQFRLAAAAVLGSMINLAVLTPYFMPSAATTNTGISRPLRITGINIHSNNSDFAALQQALLALNADIIYLLEITPAQAGALTGLPRHYPHRLIDARDNSFGMAVFSRRPFDSVKSIRATDDFAVTIEAKVRHNQSSIAILGVHFYAPLTRGWMQERNRQLEWLGARLAQNSNEPTVVIGDFNVSSYAHAFRTLVKQAALQDSSTLFGRYASWPGVLGPFGIPIDHALATKQLMIARRLISTVPGSDHRAITVDIIDLPTTVAQ